ncbi:MAG TPA: dihydrolipoamide acetyltransferase family protein [Chloroflexia bacterium]|nr:dihydrolipoamide acetyltransferase family protein [Chloroflexia bacterium]
MTIPLTIENWSDKSSGAEAVIINWFVREGQFVERDQLLAEIMVEKVNLEIAAPQPGMITRIIAPEGMIVVPGAILALLEERSSHSQPSSPPKFEDIRIEEAALPEVVLPKIESTREISSSYIAASPAARRLARRMGLELSEIADDLPEGTRINERVIRNYLERTMQSAPPEARREPQSSLRRLIRSRVSRSSQLAAPVTLTIRANVTDLLERLDEHNRLSGNTTAKLTLLAVILKATALTLQEHPLLNATLDGNDIVYPLERNISLVLPAPDGVMLPVVRQAETLSLIELAKTIDQLERAVKEGLLRLKDTLGSTFTITDLSAYGVQCFTPVLNLPQCAILGLGAVSRELALSNTKLSRNGHEDTIAVYDFVTLNLTFDHRIADGPTAGAFLQTLVHSLENPSSFLQN